MDTPVAANRENNVRAGFSIPVRPTVRLAWQGIAHPRWLFGTFLRTLVQHGMPHFENSYATRGAPILSPNVERDLSGRGHLNWRHFRWSGNCGPGRWWSRACSTPGTLAWPRMPARTASSFPTTAAASSMGRLRRCACCRGWSRPARTFPVMLDSGVRRGSDVLKALALGARFVFVGRPFSFAASVAGEAGVLKAIELLKLEVSRNMGLLGVTSLGQLDESFLVGNPAAGG